VLGMSAPSHATAASPRAAAAAAAEDHSAVHQYKDLEGAEPQRQQLRGVVQLRIRDASKVFLLADQTPVLVHVSIGGAEKWTGCARLVDDYARWDETLQFHVTVEPSRRHPMNIAQLTLYSLLWYNDSVPSTGKGETTQSRPGPSLQESGTVVFHLHDIIGATDSDMLEDCFDLWGTYQVLGILRIGLRFHYGEYGQGNSARLKRPSDDSEDAQSEERGIGGDTVQGLQCDHGMDEQCSIEDCFERLYLGAAAQDNEIKAAMAGRSRHKAFLEAQVALASDRERLAHAQWACSARSDEDKTPTRRAS
jgi:hypothetical protein